ncbi:uncharacterized protein [Temnothorax longispinosus]|uniref:uncharacterized protein n=1 Tax=Temnothorax longispinosus TaxID=300112 RepID=UPI003A99E424
MILDERNEIYNDGSTESDYGDANIIVEDEENMEINHDHVNIENDLVVNDAQINAYMLRILKEWGRRGVTRQKINGLLRILRVVFPQLSKDYRSLLSTLRNTPVKDIGNGHLWYKGIRSNIQSKLSEEYFTANQEIMMDVNIDGMKPFPQSCSQKDFWPILGSFANQDEPFIIAVFYGDGNPNDLNAFLEDYVAEVAALQESGFEINGTVYPFRVRNYILDAPARAFIKCCVGHGGTFACEKCCVTGRKYRAREIFIDMDADLRTDESFNTRQNPQHHTNNVSPLETIGTGMVSQFRLDSMHLKDQGAFKRWLKFLLVGPGNFTLTDATLRAVSNALVELAPHTPREFNRKPRQFKRSGNRLKAQELRRIALYDGVKFSRITLLLFFIRISFCSILLYTFYLVPTCLIGVLMLRKS